MTKHTTQTKHTHTRTTRQKTTQDFYIPRHCLDVGVNISDKYEKHWKTRSYNIERQLWNSLMNFTACNTISEKSPLMVCSWEAVPIWAPANFHSANGPWETQRLIASHKSSLPAGEDLLELGVLDMACSCENFPWRRSSMYLAKKIATALRLRS